MQHESSFRPCQPLKVARPTNFHDVGEIVFFEEYSFAPFVRIVGKPGHFHEGTFEPASVEDLRSATRASTDLLNSERENLTALENLLSYLRKHEAALPPLSTSSLEVRIEKTRAAIAQTEGQQP